MARRNSTPEFPSTRKRRKPLRLLILALLLVVAVLVGLEFFGLGLAPESRTTEVLEKPGRRSAADRSDYRISQEEQENLQLLARQMAGEKQLSRADEKDLSLRLELSQEEISFYREVGRQKLGEGGSTEAWSKVLNRARPVYRQLKELISQAAYLPEDRIDRRAMQELLADEKQREQFFRLLREETGLTEEQIRSFYREEPGAGLPEWALLLYRER